MNKVTLAINEVIKERQPMTKPPQDIIAKRAKKIIEYQNGARIERTVYTEVNITRMVNETKKLVKTDTATEKLAEIEKIFTK